MNKMGSRIREKRLENNWTLEELGAKLGVNRSAISKWELGETKNIKRDNIEELARLFGVSPAWLVGFDDPSVVDRVKVTLVDDDGEIMRLSSKVPEKKNTEEIHKMSHTVNEYEKLLLKRLTAYHDLIEAVQNVKPENYEKAIKLLQVLSE